MLRRDFLRLGAGLTASSTRLFGTAKLTSRERVDRALQGLDVDRPPFTLWHHFGLKSADAHAQRTLEFHRQFRTDIVKVMSDFPYPKPASGKWNELKPLDNPFPDQIAALERIHKGLNGKAYFVETIFNPFNVAEKLSSPEEVRRLKEERPQALLDALDAITESEIRHARRAIATGASGILLAVANANARDLSVSDYAKFSASFDRRILAAVSTAKLNVLHLHVGHDYLDAFRDFPPAVLNYSLHASGIPIADVRAKFPQHVIAGGVDEVNYRTLTEIQVNEQWRAARLAAGSRYILTPGCSVPNDSTPDELAKLARVLAA